MPKMVSNKLKMARSIAIGYLVFGGVYFALWFFVFTPAGYVYPILEGLFYISLPAILALPYVLLQAVYEELSARMKRFRTRDSEAQSEVTESEDSRNNAALDSEW
jgi:bacteriorhodopsin